MAENNKTNGHMDAATELEKKIIKPIEVQCKYTNYAVFGAFYILFYPSDIRSAGYSVIVRVGI